MLRYILQRSLTLIIVILGVTIITFAIINLAPGGPSIMITKESTQQTREAMKKRLGLDKAIHIRYIKWVSALIHGNLGRSYNEGRKVTILLKERLPRTLLLAGGALIISIILGIPAGVLSSTHQYSLMDHLVTFFSFVGLSVPIFWLGIMFILLFSLTLGWLPSSGMSTLGASFSLIDRLVHLVMPCVIMALVTFPRIVRYTRSTMLNVLNEDYIRTSYAKGLPSWKVHYQHGLRNAILPVITVIGLQLPRLVGSAVIVEQVFGWPGIGRLALNGAFDRDYPVIMGATLVVAVTVTMANFLVDITYAYLDPRITYD